MHWIEYLSDMDEINTITEEYNLTVIEGAAHALSVTYKDKPIGSISRLIVFFVLDDKTFNNKRRW